jgi:iron(III) transport system substrate-binding protein
MFRKLYWIFAFLLALTLVVTACGSTATPSAQPDPEAPILSGALVIYSGRREPLIQPVLDAFKAKHPEIEIVLKSGDNSQLANALIEEKGNPQADLFITTELFTVQTLYEEGVFENYVSPAAAAIPADYRQADGGWTGLTARARVIMYNTDLIKPEEAPQSIFDLADPKWKGQIAAAGSGNGSVQAQVAVLRQLVGEEETEAWLQGLLDNEVTFLGGHTDVRKAVGAGEFKIGLVNHYYYYLQKAEGSPVGVVFPDQGEGQIGLVVNATAVGIVKGGKNEAAKALVDFLLSEEGQKLFAELNYEYPLVEGVALHPDVEPLANFRLATVNLEQAIADREVTFDLLEKVGVP